MLFLLASSNILPTFGRLLCSPAAVPSTCSIQHLQRASLALQGMPALCMARQTPSLCHFPPPL